ncbi:MAG: hypothetical protein ABSA33_07105, partial [Candidatus Micrarchaeaceae archaeon]
RKPANQEARISQNPESYPYIQDSKLEGVIPSLGQKLYLDWNQVVGRNGEEKSLDRGKQGTKWGV